MSAKQMAGVVLGLALYGCAPAATTPVPAAAPLPRASAGTAYGAAPTMAAAPGLAADQREARLTGPAIPDDVTALPVSDAQRRLIADVMAAWRDCEAFMSASDAGEHGFIQAIVGKQAQILVKDGVDGTTVATRQQPYQDGQETWSLTSQGLEPLKLEHLRRYGRDGATLDQRRIKLWLADKSQLETLRLESTAGSRLDMTGTQRAGGDLTANGAIRLPSGSSWTVARQTSATQRTLTLREAKAGLVLQGASTGDQPVSTLAVQVAGAEVGSLALP